MESLPRTLDRVYESLTRAAQSTPTAPAPILDVPPPPGPVPTRAQPVFTAAPREGTAKAGPPPPGSPAASTEPWAEMEHLIALFRLSPFERDVLALLTGHSLESRFAQPPTFALAMATLDDPHWSALSSARPLRYWQLLSVDPGDLLHTPLRIDERILAYLIGMPAIDERLQPLIRPVRGTPPPTAAPGSQPAPSADIMAGVRYWSQPVVPHDPLLLAGPTRPARERAFIAICQGCEMLPFGIDAADIPDSAADREQLARLWTREAGLRAAALYIRTEEVDSIRNVASFLRALEAPVAVEVSPGSPAERLAGPRLAPGGATDAERREHARGGLHGLATRVEPSSGWDDLVLPEAQADTLRQIVLHVRYRDLVNSQWGFADRHPRGLGLTALFTGLPGTGKTTAAEVIAAELGLDLYRIDLATVVSKYIGETEKNLRVIFAAATDTDTILLFDEADALFGKRSEVRDSHDRYANLEVSYLLQQMEAYRGVAILTTNMQQALDPAFMRRLRFIVQFPFPDADARARIWRGIFPAATPVGDLDFAKLAQLNIAGGVIRNIATLAAFLAASDGGAVESRHVLAAVRTEYAKLDKPLTAAETRGLA